MKKLFTLLTMLIVGIGSSWAETYDFVTAQTKVTEVAGITSGKYYVIDGLNQVNSNAHFLFDNGTKVTSNNPQTLPTDPAEVGKFIWKIEGNSTDGWTLQNLATGNYMSLGSSNGSAISSSATPQTNGIYFGVVDEVTYATIRNSNGQAIDMGYYGNNPTTWSGSTTPGGSRRLTIYEVDVVEIADDACYYINFVSKDENTRWGLTSSASSAPSAASTGANSGDVYVAHSYINAAGNKRWIFVNNANGDFLAYHGAANSAFNISKPINEFSIDLLSGSYVSGDAPVAGKLCITADNRTISNANTGTYIIKENNAAYDNSSAPYYNGTFTSALEFNATGATASATASLAIAKFEALYEVKNYLPSAGNITALFADPSSIESNINAAATAEAAATIATNFMKSPEGKKFYAVASAATGQYMNIGPSAVSATSTTLTPEGVMELEYAGNGKYYLKGVRLEKYAGAPGNPPSTYSAKGDATAFYVGNYENATDNKVYFAKTKTNSTGEALHYNNTYTTYVTNWTYSASASQWNITAVSDAEYTELCNNYCDVTFNAIMAASGEVKATATTIDVARGSTLAMPSAIARDYCTVTFYSDAACTSAITTVPDAATATVYALVTYTPPFTLSASYENATWYYATLRGTKYVRANEGAKDGSGRYMTNTTNEKTDVYKWAFVGTNPYDLTIMNRGAGSGKYLYAESTTVPTMKAGVTPASDSKARWIATPNTTGAFALRNESGATLYINDAGGQGNLGFWNSTNSTSDAGSNWVITEVPTVDVTYEFVVGESTVNTIIVEDVPEYSEVAVPATLTNGYTTFAYNFENSGTIGGENSTITVTGTLKEGLVLFSDISNNKKYKLVCKRGGLSTYTDGESNTYLASPVKTSLSVTAKDFAILNENGRYYLYSVDDGKFVKYQSSEVAPVTDMVSFTSDAVTFTETSQHGVYAIQFDGSSSKYLNSSDSYTYGIVINSWGGSDYWDDGNQYVIQEVDDFDATTASTHLHCLTVFDNTITSVENINWSTTGKPTYNHYKFIPAQESEAGYVGNEPAIIAAMKATGYTDEYYSLVQYMNSKGVGYTLHMPSKGSFLRIKGYSDNYITSNTSGSNASMNGTASANNIVYYNDNSNLIFFGSGYGMYNTSIVAPVGSTLNAYTFSEGAQMSHYYVRSNASGMGTYCYDNTANGTKVDRNTNPVTSGSYQTDWTLEEITELPVTFKAAGLGYATFNCPVPVKIPSGVSAFVSKINENKISLFKIENIGYAGGQVIPANTPVVLHVDDGLDPANDEDYVASFEITNYSGERIDGDDFYGTVVAEAWANGTYSLRAWTKDGDENPSKVGFYTKTSGDLAGFKAWIKDGSGSARNFTIVFDGDSDPTGIVEALGLENDNVDIYDLNGRKLSSYKKGINIVNGKKVMVK